MSRVLVIIVTYNAVQWLDRCLGSLAASVPTPDVLLVDNASTDRTVEAVREFVASHPSISLTIKQMGSNLGFAAANNSAAEYALERGYDFVYLLNQDAWVMPDTIAVLVEASLRNPSYGVLSPLQMNAQMDRLDGNFAKFNSFIPSHIEVTASRFFPAAHWLLPIASLRTVGLFSPTFRHYGEDDNWIDRLHFHGLGSGVVPGARAVHDRQGRTLSRQQRCRAKCLIPVIRMSSPAFTALIWVIWAPLWLLGCSIKNFSLIPLKSIPALLRSYSSILRCRRQSRSKGAFLSKS